MTAIKYSIVFVILLFSKFYSYSQTVIWSDDFESYTNSTGIDGTGNIGDYPGLVTKWTLDVSSCTLSNASDYIKVVNGLCEIRDVDGSSGSGAILSTQTIDISDYFDVTITGDISESGSLENEDWIRFEYRIDNGSWTQFFYEQNDFGTQNTSVSGLSGRTLEIRITGNTNAGDEYIRFDNLEVSGFVTSDYFFYVSDSDNKLYTISRADGSCSEIGSTGRSYIEAIANWPANSNQILYATDEGDFGTLNRSTGSFSLIANVDADGLANGSDGSQALSDIDGLAFDPRTGELWASHRRSGDYDLLFKINPATGKYIPNAFGQDIDYIVIAGTGVYQDFDDMAISPLDGTLYGVSNNGSSDQILSINKVNGAVTVVSSLASATDVEGLGFSNDNHMYGTSGNADDFIEVFWTTGTSNVINSNMCGSGDPECLAALVEDANLIEGRVYHDDNQNQTDDSESGLAGVRVELYNDVNNNGQKDAGDEFLTYTLTDANGDYHFDFASTGNLVIIIDQTTLPSGYALTTDNIEAASFSSQNNFDSGNDFGADSGADCDGNGIPDFSEGSGDTDGDGVDDDCDLDNDNDGILDADDGTMDTDGDGIPNYNDLDSDNDGIPDAIEANGGAAPTGYNSSTGRISGTDSDNDGLLNSVDNAPAVAYGSGSTSSLPLGDKDGDGIKDFKDKDSDNDGILDIVEAGGTDSNSDGQVDSFTDSNSDGYHDSFTSSPLPIPNSDNSWETTYSLTVLPNYLDLDSDNDGIDDATEGYSTIDLIYPNILLDSDGDGIINLWDINSGGTPIDPVDTDNDGTPDYYDTDTDDDGLDDEIEGNDADFDMVADISAANTDDDGDGVDDALANGCSGNSSLNISATDHGEEDNSDGYMYLSSSDLELVNDGSTHQTIGIYFSSVDILQGATISSAYIQFETDEASTGTVSFTIKGQDIDNASSFSSTDYNITNRTLTTASATWAPSNWNTVGEAGVNQKTVDISGIIQEIVDRPGWSSGNNIVIVITGANNSSNYRTAEVDPVLHIDVVGGLSYACGTQSVLPDYDEDGEKDWRDESDDSGTLPVTLLNQEVACEGDKVVLSWSTGSEINNHYFHIMRSDDGMSFQSVGRIDGSGNSNTMVNYSFIDENPVSGRCYYQIVQVDFDGSETLFPILVLEKTCSNYLNVFPVPAESELFVETNLEGVLEIYNQNGQLMLSNKFDSGLNTLSLSFLNSGFYTILFKTHDKVIIKKLIVK